MNSSLNQCGSVQMSECMFPVSKPKPQVCRSNRFSLGPRSPQNMTRRVGLQSLAYSQCKQGNDSGEDSESESESDAEYDDQWQ